MAADFIPTPDPTVYDQQFLQSDAVGAAASSASSPGRLETSPLWAASDRFTHENDTYTLMRFYPGEDTAESITPHQPATAELPTQTGQVIRAVHATARTTALIHVTWTDDVGEILGAWCPARSVIF